MTTSQMQSFLSEVVDGRRSVPVGKLAYFRARLAGRVHQALLGLFARQEKERKLSRGELANRIHRKPEQITRWLSYPNNLTLDTASDLFIGLGYEIDQVVLRDVSTGMRVVLPESRDREVDAPATAAPAVRENLKNSLGRKSNVIDLLEALQASNESLQEKKGRGDCLPRRQVSALSQAELAVSHIDAAGLATQNQLQQRPIAHFLEKRA
jgi:hypothetical protein